jgi:hypothetical protein
VAIDAPDTCVLDGAVCALQYGAPRDLGRQAALWAVGEFHLDTILRAGGPVRRLSAVAIDAAATPHADAVSLAEPTQPHHAFGARPHMTRNPAQRPVDVYAMPGITPIRTHIEHREC